jgi:Tfp pilus assembly protein PilV
MRQLITASWQCVAIVGLIGCAAGCAAIPPAKKSAQTTTLAASGADLQCHMERPTGSLLGVRVCTTKAQRNEIKANTRSVQQQLGRTQGGACPATSPGC